jgi:hypothetical protein
MNRRFRSSLLVLPASATLFALACGGSGVGIPLAGLERESGQSSLMAKTAAGAGRCDPKAHDRPFVIEWDATDMSSFEARAGSDVVFVKYEGCDLRILEGCGSDSVKGSLGAYTPPDWTSGSVEKVDISNEGELYAKLPLGVGSLGGRVQAGEQFHMEYYVSGTRKATRDEVYRKDLAGLQRCKGATHFVYAYNLGAFALGSSKQLHAAVGATVWGIGAGGSSKSMRSAEKKGGMLSSCTGETAKESATCRVPIRLTLREITDGENPEAQARLAPETQDAMNLAAKIKMSEEAQARYKAATERMNARDGKACIRELNVYDRLDPKNASINPRSHLANTRALCVMLSGMCDAGKVQMRKAMEANSSLPAEHLDAYVENNAARYCQGSSMSPRDQLLKASTELQMGSTAKKEPAFCKSNLEVVTRLAKTVKPKDDEDYAIKNATSVMGIYMPASGCLAKAGDCEASLQAWREGLGAQRALTTESEYGELASFARSAPACKSWANSRPLSPTGQGERAFAELQRGGQEKFEPEQCRKSHEEVIRLAKAIPSERGKDSAMADVLKNPIAINQSASACYVKAGDCNAAFELVKSFYRGMAPAQQRAAFEQGYPSCKK